MKPQHSLMFLCSILIISMLFTYLSPGGEYIIGEELTVKLPHWSDLLEEEQVQYADIADITKEFDMELDEDTTVFQINESNTPKTGKTSHTKATLAVAHGGKTDSTSATVAANLKQAEPEFTYDTIHIDTDKLKANTFPIEYREGGESDLAAFTEKLQIKKGKEKLRVMFYGDSQSEADRLSNELRIALQQIYGGKGVGLMPVYDDHPSYSKSKVTFEGNWQRYNRYAITKHLVGHGKFGALLSFSRFSELKEKDRFVDVADTLVEEKELNIALADTVIKEASFTIHKQKYPKRKHYFESIKLFFGNNQQPFSVEVSKNDTILYERTVSTPKEFDFLAIKFDKPMQELTVRFKGVESPDFYGYSLEGSDGIIVDNIPLRGSSGLEFTKATFSHQQQMFAVLKPDFIVMQFGVNVAPTESATYSFYKKGLSRQIKRFRTLCPDIPILMVGLNDIARKKGLHFESYPNIEKIVDAQREAAFENHCAFWNMYEAMGGKNSMPSWVLADPPLAGKDFTHFNYKGAKIIGQMLSNAILHEVGKTNSTNIVASK